MERSRRSIRRFVGGIGVCLWLWTGVSFAAQQHVPLWLDGRGRPSADATDALALLTSAGDDGLDPRDYDAPALADTAMRLRSTPSPRTSPADAALFEARLSRGLQRYLRDLHTGRVDARRLGFRIASRGQEHDYAAEVETAVRAHRVAALNAAFAPPLAVYRDLRSALGRYRALAFDRALVPPPAARIPIRPGDAYAGLDTLHRLLSALGDLPGGVPAPAAGARYDGPIVEGVRQFQMRHGLTPDGVVGRTTLAALHVPLSQRVRQIELSLERLRWLPHIGDGPLVAVNIPMFQVWAWDSAPRNPMPALSMDVIVGRALRTQTPVLIEQMEQVAFRPYWNVPASILRDEIVPELRRDHTYLDLHDMEIVDGPGDSSPVVPFSEEALDRLSRGELRVRQRQGPRNSLGLLKFVFPNDDDIYMHGTPAQELFSRARRDFSHGCIRLEDPVALAAWILRDQGWTREQIVDATEAPASRTLVLNRPIQVVVFYITAAVMPGTGSVRFADDIYRRDGALDRALRARRPPA